MTTENFTLRPPLAPPMPTHYRREDRPNPKGASSALGEIRNLFSGNPCPPGQTDNRILPPARSPSNRLHRPSRTWRWIPPRSVLRSSKSPAPSGVESTEAWRRKTDFGRDSNRRIRPGRPHTAFRRRTGTQETIATATDSRDERAGYRP